MKDSSIKKLRESDTKKKNVRGTRRSREDRQRPSSKDSKRPRRLDRENDLNMRLTLELPPCRPLHRLLRRVRPRNTLTK